MATRKRNRPCCAFNLYAMCNIIVFPVAPAQPPTPPPAQPNPTTPPLPTNTRKFPRSWVAEFGFGNRGWHSSPRLLSQPVRAQPFPPPFPTTNPLAARGRCWQTAIYNATTSSQSKDPILSASRPRAAVIASILCACTFLQPSSRLDENQIWVWYEKICWPVR